MIWVRLLSAVKTNSSKQSFWDYAHEMLQKTLHSQYGSQLKKVEKNTKRSYWHGQAPKFLLKSLWVLKALVKTEYSYQPDKLEPQGISVNLANYKAALLDPESDKWLNAMNDGKAIHERAKNFGTCLKTIPPNAQNRCSMVLATTDAGISDGCLMTFKVSDWICVRFEWRCCLTEGGLGRFFSGPQCCPTIEKPITSNVIIHNGAIPIANESWRITKVLDIFPFPCQSFSSMMVEPSIIDPHTIKERITSALKEFRFRDKGVLVQFWSPVAVRNRWLLTTWDQPFGVGGADEGLYSHRLKSELLAIVVDVEDTEELRPQGRVYSQKLPQWSLDVNGGGNKYGYIDIPVFESSGDSCVGVLEIITSSNYVDYAFEVQEVSRALKNQNLKSPHVFEDPTFCVSSVSCN
ncbi:hypothetical protein Tco_0511717 [Tanacetum coccineum]